MYTLANGSCLCRPHAARLVTYLQSLLKSADSAPQVSQHLTAAAEDPQQRQEPAQQQAQIQPKNRPHHHPAQSMPELQMFTTHQPQPGTALPSHAQLRSSAGYGYELGIPGPSRNLSPLAHGMRSASLSCLPETLAVATAGEQGEGSATDRGTPLLPLGQEGPAVLPSAQLPYGHGHCHSHSYDSSQVTSVSGWQNPHQHHGIRHSHRLSHIPGGSHHVTHSQAGGGRTVYADWDEGRADVAGPGQQYQMTPEGLTGLAASLADLPLAGSSHAEFLQQCDARMQLHQHSHSQSPLQHQQVCMWLCCVPIYCPGCCKVRCGAPYYCPHMRCLGCRRCSCQCLCRMNACVR